MTPPFLWIRLRGPDLEKELNSETWGAPQNLANFLGSCSRFRNTY